MKDTHIQIRVSKREKREWKEAAERFGLTPLSNYIRFCVFSDIHVRSKRRAKPEGGTSC